MFRSFATQSRKILITGGAGFIGTNLAEYLLKQTNAHITVFDNLSKPGAEQNVRWLTGQALPYRFSFVRGDVCNAVQLAEALRNADDIYHLANRVPASGISLRKSDVALTGTRTLLEVVSRSGRKLPIVFASSSVVYGTLPDLPVRSEEKRYVPADPSFRGVSESAPIDVSSMFNRAQIAAERCIREYARERDVPAIILRFDTIVGPRQFRPASHHWVARMIYDLLERRPVVIEGDGLQVYDVLHVSDIVAAMIAACDFAGVTGGRIYNVGGGYSRSMSVLEMLSLAERVCSCTTEVVHGPARPNERRLYFADSSSFQVDTGWRPRLTIEQAVREVAAFWHANLQERRQHNIAAHTYSAAA